MTKKKATATRKTTTIETEFPAQVAETDDDLDLFERARLEFSGASRVKLTIYRYDDGETSYLKRVDYDPETIDEEWIRKRWGAGAYQLRFLDSENPQSRWSRVVTIAPDAPTAAAGAAGNQSSDHFLLETLRRQNEILLQAVIGRAGAPASSGGDVLGKIVEGMQAQNTALLQASLARTDMSGTLLTFFEKGLQIAADAKSESEGGWLSQIGRVAKDLLPALQEVAKMRADAPRAYPGGVTPTTPRNPPPPGLLVAGKPTNGETLAGAGAPVSGGFVATAPAPPPLETESDVLEQSIRSFAPQILEAIQQGSTPEDVASAILDAIPPRFYGEFSAVTPELVFRAAPELAGARGFVVELVKALREEAGGDEETGAGAAP